ncbi:PAS domain S-box-containing protein/diguanylate cyclase (GGDEF) domain-containing protein [Marinobacter persicus]|uniref:PAS domain S-box-containing protein/diguanylate cyclase (GGDEF) domain-containing protein n=1 Tax=Marinobacter persicus TaxID=930118 RepID=A0A1I3P2C7_9GAMM|nr:diguanylate cyclase [Marinobacter persicus]GHD51040.1 hypothetical protein GCM10008110_22430 [Marinobacter persicus]SFJ15683.1 PAS domain S-box-containing protein/diguanylate cyclase (GGDEF) domain-containing protein [Marinobacter persicus]
MNIQDQRRQIVTRSAIAAVMTGILVAVAVAVPLINKTSTLTTELAANVAKTKTENLRTVLEQHQDLARQTASRTELAKKLGAYARDEISLGELQTFTYPRLRDAARGIDNLAAIVRFDLAGNEVARIGPMAQTLPQHITLPTALDLQTYPLATGGQSQPLLHTIGKIQTSEQAVGYDLLLFTPEPFQRIFTSDDNFDICLLDVPRTKRLAMTPDNQRVVLTPPSGCLHDKNSTHTSTDGDYALARTADGAHVISFVLPLEGYSWEVHTRSEASEIFSGVTREILVALSIILGLSAFSGLLVKRSLKPLVHTLSRQADEIARSSEELRQAYQVFEHTHEVVVIADLQLNIIRANPAFIDVTGLPARKVIRQKITDFLATDMSNQKVVEWLQEQLATQKMWQGEIWLQTAKGRASPYLVTVSPITDSLGQTRHYVMTFTDIAERVKSEKKIHHLAHHDELTGLPNRSALEQHLRQTLDQHQDTRTLFAVMFLDLDKFKPVNDEYGHNAGDDLLAHVAKRLQNCLREGDFVGRRGGDEFQIITARLRQPDDAEAIATKIINVLNEPFEIQGHTVGIGASVGIALYPRDGRTAIDLVGAADAAMYRVKAEGRNNVAFA